MAEPEALQIRQIMSELDAFTENAIIDITLELSDRLKEATPIDTGYAKSNWIISNNDVSEPVGPPGNPALAASIQSAQEGGMLGYKLAHGPVYLSNAVAYIGTLVNSSKIFPLISGVLMGANLGIRRRR